MWEYESFLCSWTNINKVSKNWIILWSEERPGSSFWVPHHPVINNYQQFRFNWSVCLEIDCGIVSCFGAVKFSSGGQNSRSWLAVKESGETRHNKMWSWLGSPASLLFHSSDWDFSTNIYSTDWAPRDPNIIHTKEGFLFSSTSPVRALILPGEMFDPSCPVCQCSGWWYQLTLVFTL